MVIFKHFNIASSNIDVNNLKESNLSMWKIQKLCLLLVSCKIFHKTVHSQVSFWQTINSPSFIQKTSMQGRSNSSIYKATNSIMNKTGHTSNYKGFMVLD